MRFKKLCPTKTNIGVTYGHHDATYGKVREKHETKMFWKPESQKKRRVDATLTHPAHSIHVCVCVRVPVLCTERGMIRVESRYLNETSGDCLCKLHVHINRNQNNYNLQMCLTEMGCIFCWASRPISWFRHLPLALNTDSTSHLATAKFDTRNANILKYKKKTTKSKPESNWCSRHTKIHTRIFG